MSDGPRARYLEATVREWLGLPRSADARVPNLPDRLARRLLRLEEYESPHRDQWDCWEYGFCESYRAGKLLVPEIDEWAASRRRELSATVELVPLWPDGRPFAMCLTHDVDLVSDASTVTQSLRSMRYGLAPGGPQRSPVVRFATPAARAGRALAGGIARHPNAEQLELSLALEQRRGVRASYFFTVYPSTDASRFDCVYAMSDRCRFRGRPCRVRDVLRLLSDEGFDVGLHGSYPSAIRPDVLVHERERLEEAANLEIVTTRQHFLHWDVRATPKLQEAAGLRADTTVGFNRAVGFRAGTSLPFRLFDAETETPIAILEVPLTLHDGPLLRADGLELDADLARETIQLILDQIAAVSGVATLSFHPNNLTQREFLDLYEWALDYALDRGAWIASLYEMDAWWRHRAALLE